MKNISELMRLDGKVALITGGSGYLGSAISETLAELGATTIITGTSEDKAIEYATFVKEKYKTMSLGIKLDFLDDSDIVRATNLIKKDFCHLDILVNNGGIRKKNTLETISKEDWLFDIDHCLNGTFYLTKAMIPLLKVSQGVIVNIASMYGHIAPDYRIYNKDIYTNPPSYGVAKAGIIQFTKYLASFLSPYNIRCNTISPGAFPFGFTKDDNDFMENLKNKSMQNRIGVPDDIKGAIAFLASDLGKFVNAQNICIDGGWAEW